MIRRLIKVVVLGVILGLITSFGVSKYQSDQDALRYQIDQIQRQQEMLSIFTIDVVMEKILGLAKSQNRTIYTLDDLVTIVDNIGNPLPDLVNKIMSSVVYIEAPGQWSGSGVIVDPHVVLTARHVVKGADKLKIETADGKIYKAINWIEDKDNDCGLIFFDPREKFENVSEFADSDELQIGEVVFTVGSPYGKQLFNTVTLGIISGLDRNISYFGTCGLITSHAAGNPGNSGGPVFDMRGKIIGILVGTKWGSRGLSIIIPSNVCQELLENE